jgi:putative phosphoesterase
MRIGLISDTHIPQDAAALPGQVKEIFRNVDLILHAGDIYIASVLDELETIAPVMAAAGDDDYADVRQDNRVKERHILTVEDTAIWLVHLIFRPWLKNERAPDVIVLGHSHSAAIERRNGILMVNPGSPTCPHNGDDAGTVGILEVDRGRAKAGIVRLW